MTKQQIIKTLTEFNEWRRSGEGDQPPPEVIGKAIDSAIELLQAIDLQEIELKHHIGGDANTFVNTHQNNLPSNKKFELQEMLKDFAIQTFIKYRNNEPPNEPVSDGDIEGKFAEWLQENRWFSFIDDKWNYTFEGGTAISNANYDKHYRKTTKELFDKFIAGYKAAQQPQEVKWISVDGLNEYLKTKMKLWLIPTSLDEEVLQIKAESYNEAIVDIRKHILSLPKQPQDESKK